MISTCVSRSASSFTHERLISPNRGSSAGSTIPNTTSDWLPIRAYGFGLADSLIRRHLSGLVDARCTNEVVPARLKRSLCGITRELRRQRKAQGCAPRGGPRRHESLAPVWIELGSLEFAAQPCDVVQRPGILRSSVRDIEATQPWQRNGGWRRRLPAFLAGGASWIRGLCVLSPPDSRAFPLGVLNVR